MTYKKYYYLKLRIDFFEKPEIINLEKHKRYKCIILYIHLLCKGDYYKRGYRIHKLIPGISIEDYFKIIYKFDYINLKYLIKLNLIKVVDNNLILRDINVDLERNRGCKKYKEWRDAVFKRDNYTCQICNIKGTQLNAHHIKSWNNYPKLRHDINNGITLCAECHRKIHKGECKIGNIS